MTGFDIEWPDLTPVFSGEGWAVIPALGGLEVVIDGIPYKVSAAQLPDGRAGQMACSAALYFKTGEVLITSTRESLDYRGSTIVNIIQRLDVISEHAVSMASAATKTMLFLGRASGSEKHAPVPQHGRRSLAPLISRGRRGNTVWGQSA